MTNETYREETWKHIDNYPDYQISNLGRLKSLRRKQPKILKGRRAPYKRHALCNDSGMRFFSAHELVLIAFTGARPSSNHDANHKDFDKHNNKLENLEWVTKSENSKHAYDHGRMKMPIWRGGTPGIKNNHHKLEENDVRTIRWLLKTKKFTQEEIAMMFKLDDSSITYISRGKTWRHLK